MQDLKIDADCWYQLSDEISSNITFRSGIPERGDKGHVVAVYGDFGIDNDKSMDKLTSQAKDGIFGSCFEL